MRNNKARQPAVAGQFYPSNAEKLKEEIKSCFLSEFGPGKLPSGKTSRRVLGAVCPHAGYQFSGPCAAWAYKEIAESNAPDVYVMLGLSHMGFPSCVSLIDWKTPLGIVKNDVEFSKMLAEKGIPANEKAHSTEHSIEVQVPFLQFACPEPKIVPVIASQDMDYQKIASAIRETAKVLGKKIVVIASSDFTHYGPAYSYVPFSENVKENIHKLDKGAIDLIKNLDAEGFMKYAAENQATICGQLPIACLIEAIDAKNGKLLKYYTSGDVVGDYANAVGYASIVFEK